MIVGYTESEAASGIARVSLDTGVPGLILANTTQIYPEDRGTNYSVDLGNRIAATVIADLTSVG